MAGTMETTDIAAGSPTLEMVAALAGVSRSTVSRVINDSPKVTPQAIASVEAAIEQLGYVPNRAARTLASRRTQSVALVIPETTAKFFGDPYFAEVIQGAALRLADTDYTLSLLISAENGTDKVRRYLAGGNVDGAIVLSHHSDDLSYISLARSVPLIFGGRPMSAEGPAAHYVDVDNVHASQVVTERLIAAGRRRIATIAGPADMSAGQDRLEGWRAAVTGAGLSDEKIERGDFSPDSGAAAAARLLERGERFDGLFIASSLMASGALGVLRQAGIRIPEDAGVVTFDNDYFAQNANPPLTTIEQPTGALGRRLATELLRLIAGEPVPRVTVMPTLVVERGSE